MSHNRDRHCYNYFMSTVRRALLTLEGCKAAQYPFQADGAQQLQVPDWERYIAQMALEILKEQSPKRLLAIRAK